MNHPWLKQIPNLEHELSHNASSNQNLSTKAYLNPQIVNYEFFKRTLSKNCVRRSNKIHVNPNFRRNGESNLSKENFSTINHAINSQDILPEPGSSKIFSILDKNSISSSSSANERKGAMVVPMQTRFKKINAVNNNSNNNINSMYSWSRSTNNSNFLRSDSENTCMPPINKIDSVLEKPINFYYNPLEHKCTSHKSDQSVVNHSIYKSKTKIINKSKTKMLNNFSPKTKLCYKDNIYSPTKRQLNLSKFKYNKNKKSSASRVARAVKNKYIYLSNLEQFKRSQYKIDKRCKLSETVKKKPNLKDIRKLFPSYIYNRIKFSPLQIPNLDSSKSVIKNINPWRTNKTYSKVTDKMTNNKFPNRRVVKIGGILYKSTANKLTLASKKVEDGFKKTLCNATKAKKNYIVYVRGEKFILENNGKALRRQSEDVASEKSFLLTPKRIDIGGVTYIQKSQNILIRTNVHQARHLVNKAKNKSIALLVNLHKRSSLPCMIYHRFGRCIRHTKGLCMYKHDPKNIAVCKKFLRGTCNNNSCSLSHEVVHEKMATCHFFLNGLCIKENCPYLHVRLNKNAAICDNFLQGFCNLGKECTKRHLHQCPKFDKDGSCNLGSKCPYPHKTLNRAEDSENPNKPKSESETLQYYVQSDTKKQQKNIKGSKTKANGNVSTKAQEQLRKKRGLSINDADQTNTAIECFPKRIKLDKLPCFIPLNSDS